MGYSFLLGCETRFVTVKTCLFGADDGPNWRIIWNSVALLGSCFFGGENYFSSLTFFRLVPLKESTGKLLLSLVLEMQE